ncbi:unnamed protein product [Closterium sp. NIES-65]|nr:unnamed protein product [Closterium sp. NIES-65]
MHHAVFHLATSAQDLSANLFQQRLKVFVSFFSTLKALKSLRVLMHSTPRATANANIGMPISSAMKASNQANNHRLPLTSPHHACPPCPPAGHCNTSACCSHAKADGGMERHGNVNQMWRKMTSDGWWWWVQRGNICGSTGAAGTLCGGGYCTPNATTPAVAGTPNTEGQAVVALFCQGGPIEPSMRGAMLNLKASLGVTLTDWVGTAPCKIAGQSTVVGARSNVECNATGKVTSM